MGKGGGCASSSAAQPLDAKPPVKDPNSSAGVPASPAVAVKPTPIVETQDPVADVPAQIPAVKPEAAQPSQAATPAMTKPCTVYVIVHTIYGHVYKLACALRDGIREVEGCNVTIFQVPETLPDDVLAKMYAAPKPDVPVITADKLPQADGLVFGYPTRFGLPCAQMLEFLSSTDGEWEAGALLGKPVTAITSVGCQGGGTDTTTFSCMTAFVAHGMIYIPPAATQNHMEQGIVHGCGVWGAGTIAGADGSRQPTAAELDYAKKQGARFAGFVKKLQK